MFVFINNETKKFLICVNPKTKLFIHTRVNGENFNLERLIFSSQDPVGIGGGVKFLSQVAAINRFDFLDVILVTTNLCIKCVSRCCQILAIGIMQIPVCRLCRFNGMSG